MERKNNLINGTGKFVVDLNSDLGEGFGTYKMPNDEDIIGLITSANIACGWHAGDPLIMQKSVIECKSKGTKIGAHPSYPDLLGFGRRELKISKDEAMAYIIYQVGALKAFCEAAGMSLDHVKPHGALYNAAAKDYELARAIAKGIKACGEDLIVVGLAGSELIRAAKDENMRVASEVFADRAYNDDGTLVSRNLEGAVIHDEKEMLARTIKMIKEGNVTSINGKQIPIKADSLCVHGDTKEALSFIKAIRQKFDEEGIAVAPLSEICNR